MCVVVGHTPRGRSSYDRMGGEEHCRTESEAPVPGAARCVQVCWWDLRLSRTGTCGWMRFSEGGLGIPASESLEEGGRAPQEHARAGGVPR